MSHYLSWFQLPPCLSQQPYQYQHLRLILIHCATLLLKITSVVFSDVCSDSLCYVTAEYVLVVFSDVCSDSLCYTTAESSQWCSVMSVLIHCATLLLNQWCSAIPVLIHCATLLLNHLSGIQRYLFWFTVLPFCWITSVVFSDVCSDSLCYTTAESPQWYSVMSVLIHRWCPVWKSVICVCACLCVCTCTCVCVCVCK